MVAAGDRRQYVGNDGYDDDPPSHYSWDDRVPQHAEVAEGDAIVLWDGDALVGASIIEQIALGPPDVPLVREVDVVTYQSQHDIGEVDLAGCLSGSELRALCVDPKSQHSLRPLRWDAFRTAVAQAAGPLSFTVLDVRVPAPAEGHRVMAVRVRFGQPAFRRRLLREFGPVCAFTGPAPAAALEACHLYSYASQAKHHYHGGLLLRRDLHRLFDLGLITVDPRTMHIEIAPPVRSFPTYAALAGQPLAVPATPGHRAWLDAHWNEHRTQ